MLIWQMTEFDMEGFRSAFLATVGELSPFVRWTERMEDGVINESFHLWSNSLRRARLDEWSCSPVWRWQRRRELLAHRAMGRSTMYLDLRVTLEINRVP